MTDIYKNYVELKNCLCCNSLTKLFLNLGNQPLANNYHKLNEKCDEYPLKLTYCPNCYHCQLSHIVDPEILFTNYKYVSGTSQTGLDFFESNAEFIIKYKNINCGKVLDIACNDGSQLDFFKKLGWETYGIDPAKNLYKIAVEKGHKIVCDFLSEDSIVTLPIMDVITAQNVFAHTQSVDSFLQICKKLMNKNTSLFIQTSQKNMILNNEFDTIYHEHVSFFNTKSMKLLVEKNGLFLVRVLSVPIHGNSYIFEIKLNDDVTINNVTENLLLENSLNLYKESTYELFSKNVNTIISNIKLELEKYRYRGYKCIGFGSSAKGQTVLCFGNINLDYIIDENELKINTYSPKQNIPIVDIQHFINDSENNILVVILAWNFASEIIKKINKFKNTKNIIILESYFPSIKIYNL